MSMRKCIELELLIQRFCPARDRVRPPLIVYYNNNTALLILIASSVLYSINYTFVMYDCTVIGLIKLLRRRCYIKECSVQTKIEDVNGKDT